MATPQPSGARTVRELFPKLYEVTDKVVFGDIWERPELSKRDRSLMIIGVLTALYRTDQLRGRIGRGLDNGLSKVEIVEAITQIAFYAGWPCAVNGAAVAEQVFDERGV